MTPESSRPEAIFAAALEIADLAARAAYLERTCGADSGLRQEVEMLLAAHAGAEAGDFMGKQATLLNDAIATVVSASREEQAGDRIDRYKLLEPIGEGGFGVVWMAEQQEPVRRRVALKVIKLGMDTRQVTARFEAERQALALMDHPNIARVFDGGATTQGRPYFVMELIKGVPITEYCDQQRLDPRQRLELFIQVCQGVQHAHQKGIIHRDLKPSNILVAVHDDKPVPKIIDFGIAKATQQPLTEQTVFTRFQQLVGTPAYMSPEQAGMSSLDIDTRSDVYSLGVLLYELLTRRTPFSKDELLKAGFEEMCRVIREKEPPKPSTKLSGLGVEELKRVAQQRHAEPQRLGRLVRGELDWIVLKALEKDRSRRYETANGFARDIERYLNQEPVSAVAPTFSYQLLKFARRHRVALGTATAFAVVLLTASVFSSWQAIRASRLALERDQQFRVATNATAQATGALKQSEQAREESEFHLYCNRIALALAAWERGDAVQADRQLDDCPERLRGWEWNYVKRLNHSELLSFSAAASSRVRESAGDLDGQLSFTQDGSKVWVLNDRGAGLFDSATGTLVSTVTTNWSGPKGVLTPDGRWFIGNTNGLRGDEVAPAQLVDAISGQLLLTFDRSNWGTARGLLISEDGTLMALRTTNGLDICTLPTGNVRTHVLKANGVLTPIAFTRDDTQLLLGQHAWNTNWLKVIRIADGGEVLRMAWPNAYWENSGDEDPNVAAAAFSPDGRLLAIVGESHPDWDGAHLEVWEVPGGHRLVARQFDVEDARVGFCPGADKLFVTGRHQWKGAEDFWLLNATNGINLHSERLDNGLFSAHRFVGADGEGVAAFSGMLHCAISPNNRLIAVAGMDRILRVLSAESGRELRAYRGHASAISRVAFSSDGRRLASLDRLGVVKVWDATGTRASRSCW